MNSHLCFSVELHCCSSYAISTINVKGGNELTGQIPSELGTVTSLQVIDVGKSLLKYCDTICKILNLDNLSDYIVFMFLTSTTGDNELSGEIPSEIGNLAFLQNFDAGEIATVSYLIIGLKSFVYSNL